MIIILMILWLSQEIRVLILLIMIKEVTLKNNRKIMIMILNLIKLVMILFMVVLIVKTSLQNH